MKSMDIFNELREQVKDCKKCEISATRTNAVFGEGSAAAKVMFIGEAPGQDEDAQGRPFVGRAGKLLTQLIEEIGMSREEVYITNVIKCRPPGNRDPLPDEMLNCRDYLMAQIAFIQPQIVCSLGRIAFQALYRHDVSITKLHGESIRWKGMILMPIYHPAATLHRAAMLKDLKEDFQKLKDLIERTLK
ncbi:MAG: uracil-DNA glycosylase [bacterium]